MITRKLNLGYLDSHIVHQLKWCVSKHQSSGLSTLARRFKTIEGRITQTEGLEQAKQIAKQFEADYLSKYNRVLSGGGPSGVKRHVMVNKKILPRERIKMLVDKEYPALEIAPFAGMDLDYGDVCSAGGICVIAKISGQLCIIHASDATVKGGTVFPIGVKKQLRMQEIAEENNLPCLYIIDSGGAFLPLQSEIFPETGGKVFYNEARMNALSIPQICIVAGSCTAGAAYIPTMANEVIMVDKIGSIFLAGPPLVAAAIGEIISEQDLGGASVHCDVSGCADYKSIDEIDAIETTKDVMTTLNLPSYTNSNRFTEEPFFDNSDLPALSVARNSEGKLDIRMILARLLDGSRFQPYKPNFGSEILTGFGYLNGFLVGIVANDGVRTSKSCLKAANFVFLCKERGVPIIFLQDIISGQDSLSNEDKALLIKNESQLMSAVATAAVPKITLIMGRSFGPSSYAMCGRSMGPRFLFSWPCAQVSSIDTDVLDDTDRAQLQKESCAFFGSARLWNDGVILPQDTRRVLSVALEACLSHKQVERSSNINAIRM